MRTWEQYRENHNPSLVPRPQEGPRMMEECSDGPPGLLLPGLIGKAAGRGGIRVWWLLSSTGRRYWYLGKFRTDKAVLSYGEKWNID